MIYLTTGFTHGYNPVSPSGFLILFIVNVFSRVNVGAADFGDVNGVTGPVGVDGWIWKPKASTPLSHR
ncbi:hypothetical protein Q4534_13635 [Cyclobacterium sp. 1_MG-2023]|uniref:hypothetical protein n=1 Tax=Cyclobacterium sp. 1_MG-2023 TaxID=3062681 RepID=UPI0026E47BE2|nr:hypothetical protein [Cyclobacterium sp. 1_MG-2023]MDO6438458.1 hypothetical protein [Cyclobacterium sp. 1_MG-2023]